MKSNLEKFLFLEMTWKQFGKIDQREYYKTIELLSKEEEEMSINLSSEVHKIYTRVNVNFIDRINVHSIQEYNDNVAPVSEIILKVSSDFGITLKGEISDEFKKAIQNILGQDYLDDFLKSVNQ